MRRAHVVLVAGVLIACLLGAYLLTIGTPRQPAMPTQEKSAQEAPTQERYDTLVEEMRSEIRNDPEPYVLSSRRYHTTLAFKKIVQLGRPVVPLVIADLQLNKGNYTLDLLNAILPDVQLDRYYGNADYRYDDDIHKAYWLRWWSEHGSKQDWSK